MQLFKRDVKMISPEEALPGRERPAFDVPERHEVLGTPLEPPFPEGIETAVVALGWFWGAEQLFWRMPGVCTTAGGYAGGFTPNPTYEEVCSGRTGHAEAVLVAFDPKKVSYESLLKTFFEEHDPTQGMRQGNDVGTQYRSAIYYANEEQRRVAEMVRDEYNPALKAAGKKPIMTESVPAGPFHYAEDYHPGCGGPSFTETVSPEAVELLEDRAHGMVRTEVRCARCGSHLGHVFPDGPQDRGGLRYCMNSVALELDGCGPSRLAGRPAGQAGRGCQPSDRQLGFNRAISGVNQW